MTAENKLTKKRRLGYASGIISESVLYNLFITYYLVFLTDIVHIEPAIAGTIIFVSTCWDALSDPIVGYHSDQPGRDKRRFMLRSLLPMALAAIACFIAWPDFSTPLQVIYYVAATIIFWLCYTYYTIPYYSVLPEITQDYDERTKIRGYSALLNVIAIFIGAALPSFLPELLQEVGMSETMSWAGMVALFAAIAVLFGVIATRSLRDLQLKRTATAQLKKIWTTFFHVAKLKPVKWLCFFVVTYLMASSMIQANIIYTIENCLGLGSDMMTPVMGVLIGCMLIFVPLSTKLANKTDRRTALIVFFGFMLVGLVAAKIIGLNELWVLMLASVAMSAGTAAFWTVFYAMAYDIVEIDEFVNGVRREGVITALPQLVQKLGSAFGIWLAGILLTINGYNSYQATQTPQAIEGIENIQTIIPAALLGISIVCLVFYPVSKKRFNLLQTQLIKKRNGEKYSKEGLDKLV